MKKQFAIKPVNAVKDVTKSVAKFEIASLFGLLKEKNGSCGVDPAFTGVTQPNFSL